MVSAVTEVDRLMALLRAVPKAQRAAIIAVVREMVDVHVQARQRLEVKLKALETASGAEHRIRAMCTKAEAKIDEQQAQLDKMNKQLGALLAPTAATRRTAAARLRQ